MMGCSSYSITVNTRTRFLGCTNDSDDDLLLYLTFLPRSVAMRPLSFMRSSVQDALSLARNDSTLSTNSRGSMKDKKNSQASRWVHLNMVILNKWHVGVCINNNTLQIGLQTSNDHKLSCKRSCCKSGSNDERINYDLGFYCPLI